MKSTTPTHTAVGRPLVRPLGLEQAVATDLLPRPTLTSARILMVAQASPLRLHYLVVLTGEADPSTLSLLVSRWSRHAHPADGVRAVLMSSLSKKDQLLFSTYTPTWSRSTDYAKAA